MTKSSKWLKTLNKKFQRCFKKVRVTRPKTKNQIQQLLSKRVALKKRRVNLEDRDEIQRIEVDINNIEEDIAQLTAADNSKLIREQVDHMTNLTGGFFVTFVASNSPKNGR